MEPLTKQIYTWFWLENMMEGGHLEDLGIDGGSYLRYVYGIRKESGLYSCGSGRGPVAGCVEHSNGTPCSVNCWRFVECVRDSRFMKNDARHNS